MLEEKNKEGEPQEKIETTESREQTKKGKTRAWPNKTTIAKLLGLSQLSKEESLAKLLFDEAILNYKNNNLDRAINILKELKEFLPETQKKPGFFSKTFGRVPLYVKVEDHISKIENQKILEEKRRIRESRKQTKKEKRHFFIKIKEILRKFMNIPLLFKDYLSKIYSAFLYIVKRVFILFECFLFLRLILKFFDANPQALVVNFIYKYSDIFISPFQYIFPDIYWRSYFIDVVTISAMIGYAILIFVILQILRIFSRD